MKKNNYFCILLLLNLYLFSHPHMYIDSKVSFEFTESKLKGFWISWYFDEMFSEGILMDYDSNNDRIFDNEEILSVEMGAFANLENYNYFLFVNFNNKESKINAVEKFNVLYKDNRIIYKFFVPYEIASKSEKQHIKVSIYDETFFCDIAYIKKDPVEILNIKKIESSFKITKNKEKTINYSNVNTAGGRENISYTGQMSPKEIILEFKNKQ